MSTKNLVKNNIAVVVPYKFIPPTDGGQRVAYEFCLALSKRVKLFCVSTKQKDTTPDLEVIDALAQSIGKYLSLFSIIKLVRLFRNRKVWLCIVNHPYLIIVAYIACKICRVKLAIYSHNLEYRRFFSDYKALLPIVFLMEYFAYRHCDMVFFISTSEMEHAVRCFGLKKSKCRYVPIIATRPKSRRLPVTKKEDDFSIIFYGNFSYPPNLLGLKALLFEICPLLSERCYFPYNIKIFGSNFSGIKKQFLKADKGCDTVEFMGYVDDLVPHIQNADVMVNPVHTGAGSSMKVMDALCQNTTVVSARIGAEGIGTKDCGRKLLLVDDKKWDQYVTMILRVREEKLDILPTPQRFFDAYSENRIMESVLSGINAVRG